MTDKKENVTDLPVVPPEDVPQAAKDAASQNRLVGYILSPESMGELLEQVENIPGRYYKRMAPCLQNASPVFEDGDGEVRVMRPPTS